MNSSFFGDMLQTIADRGRALLAGRNRRVSGEARTATLIERCEDLLSGRGEASGTALAREILIDFQRLKTGERVGFFEALSNVFGPDREALRAACEDYAREPTEAAASAVHEAAEPRRQELVRRLNLAPGATAALVAMREQLLDSLPLRPDLAGVDYDFVHLLSSWFNRGFLVLRRIDWSSPANVLEKIIRYEAVHEISDWDDLRARIDSPDRRCYAFFHPAMTDEPLIFVEVALTREIPDAIAPILSRERTLLDPREATTATFYSISNTQRGLTGVTFGSFLIKQVVEEISRELPNLSTFVTLSPVPGFMRWLAAERATDSPAIEPGDREALAHLDSAGWQNDPRKVEELRAVLGSLAAYYFLSARTKHDRPVDPVARFHLGNGARLERIDLMADLSEKAITQSAGTMVNYQYVLADIEKNHEAYAEAGEVVASNGVKRMLRPEKARALAAQP
ncbi:MAG TPA: malonyl-CoA decarboxylase [Xanthobacteraceae bacterium]|nr:malonyl-CoA decarboxylase [Xanthobacteraceae bacterium]